MQAPGPVFWLLPLLLFLLVEASSAARPRVPGRSSAADKSDVHRNATFQQPIDHGDPSLGTFSQFYYYNDKHWAGPASPVIFFTPVRIN